MNGNRTQRLTIGLALAGVLVAAGCIEEEKRDDPVTADGGADSDGGGGTSDTVSDSASSGGDVDGTDGGSSSSGSSGGADVGIQTVPTAFKAACTTETDCKKNHLCIDGACVPKLASTITSKITDPSNDNQPTAKTVELGCIGKSIADLSKGLPAVAEVTMWGRVDRFGGGGLTVDVEVTVFRAEDFKPEACAQIVDKAASWACYGDDSKVGKPLAKVVSVDPADAAAKGWDVTGRKYKDGEDCSDGVHLECPHGSVCDKIDNVVQCGKNHGVFAMEKMPTNTPLIIRTRPLKFDNPSGWHDSYLWNVVLFSDRLDDKGAGKQPTKYVDKDTYRYNPTIVGQGQWDLVPETIGILGGITDGYGVIGGRIRDCGDAQRRSWPIVDAKVGIGIPPAGLTYFNDSETSTVPNKSRTTTNILGRYAAVDIPPGPNRVAVVGRLDGKDVTLSSTEVYVIPNALVIVSTPGYNPQLNK